MSRLREIGDRFLTMFRGEPVKVETPLGTGVVFLDMNASIDQAFLPADITPFVTPEGVKAKDESEEQMDDRPRKKFRRPKSEPSEEAGGEDAPKTRKKKFKRPS